MNSIIITSIICISIILIVCVFCYTNYKIDKNSDANIFNRNVTHTIKQYDTIIKEINSIKDSINTIYTVIDFINKKLNSK